MVTQPQKSDNNTQPGDAAITEGDGDQEKKVDHNTRSATPTDETTAVAYTLPEPTTPGQPETQRRPKAG